MEPVSDLVGHTLRGLVHVILHPGQAIRGEDGAHLEGGPHAVPVAVAQELIGAGRAVPAPAPAVAHGDPAIDAPGDPAVEHRDPVAE